MRIILVHLFYLLLFIVATGCESLEHSRAVEQGDDPWYMVTITSPDAKILEGEMNIYKLLRKADSPEGKKDKLKADKRWGEGHGEIEATDKGKIMMHARISWDQSDPTGCLFEVSATFLGKKEPFMFEFESKKLDRCEKSEFERPYFSGRIQTEDRDWKTLNFQFRRAGIGQ